jgi:hypothetical protein
VWLLAAVLRIRVDEGKQSFYRSPAFRQVARLSLTNPFKKSKFSATRPAADLPTFRDDKADRQLLPFTRTAAKNGPLRKDVPDETSLSPSHRVRILDHGQWLLLRPVPRLLRLSQHVRLSGVRELRRLRRLRLRAGVPCCSGVPVVRVVSQRRLWRSGAGRLSFDLVLRRRRHAARFGDSDAGNFAVSGDVGNRDLLIALGRWSSTSATGWHVASWESALPARGDVNPPAVRSGEGPRIAGRGAVDFVRQGSVVGSTRALRTPIIATGARTSATPT